MTTTQRPAPTFGFPLVLATACAALLLAGCASDARAPGQGPAAPPPVLGAPGYRAAAGAVQRWAGVWPMAGQAQPVDLTAPAGAARGPLLVYLPGLGEAADAGQRWRAAWAAAGYTVLGVQPLAEDALAWQSTQARDGDFRALARERLSAREMQRRLAALAAVLAEARRRGLAGEPLLQAATAPDLVLAGDDLGAHTAMVAAGERLAGVQAPDWAAAGWTLRAVLAISPPPASDPQPGHYAGVQVPVLAITSTADRDPLGRVDNPLLRTQAFDQLAARPRALLLLDSLPHGALAGNASLLPPQRQADGAPRGRSAEAGMEAGTGRGGRGGHGGMGGGGPGGPGGGGGGGGAGAQRSGPGDASGDASGNTGEGRQARRGDGPRDAPGGRPATLSEASAQVRLSAAITLSTAFLDARVRAQPGAGAWLDGEAARWLGPVGELEQR